MQGKKEEPKWAVETKNLTRSFGKNLRAVDRLNLSIKRGEIFALLGPNGAGKTTTIKMLCCLLQPSSGNATVMGNDISRSPRAVKQVINMSPQETAVAPNLTARENLILMGRIYGLNHEQARARAEDLLQTVELGARSREAVKRFSGGMLRRLSLAMALISDPRVLFLDEPTTGLDARSRKSLWELIESYRGRKTIVMTTHYLEEADFLADRLAIINQGRLVALGTSEELKRELAGLETMTIQAENLTPTAAEGLKKIYPRVRLNGEKLIIEGEKLDFDTVVDFLRGEGVRIKWLSMKEPSLDEIYLKITEGGPIDESA